MTPNSTLGSLNPRPPKNPGSQGTDTWHGCQHHGHWWRHHGHHRHHGWWRAVTHRRCHRCHGCHDLSGTPTPPLQHRESRERNVHGKDAFLTWDTSLITTMVEICIGFNQTVAENLFYNPPTCSLQFHNQ